MPLKTSMSEELPSVNLTSMIDVVFLLIIFFMVGTKFTDPERQIGIKLPAVGAVGAMIAPPLRRQINVTQEGTIFLDKQSVSIEQLLQQLSAIKAEYPSIAVVVNGDRDAKFDRVASVLGVADQAGITNLSIRVRSQQQLSR